MRVWFLFLCLPSSLSFAIIYQILMLFLEVDLVTEFPKKWSNTCSCRLLKNEWYAACIKERKKDMRHTRLLVLLRQCWGNLNRHERQGTSVLCLTIETFSMSKHWPCNANTTWPKGNRRPASRLPESGGHWLSEGHLLHCLTPDADWPTPTD